MSKRHLQATLLAVLPATLLGLWTVPATPQVTRDAVPGGLVELPLGSIEVPRPAATFGRKPILVMESGSRWVGLVGLPLDLVPGRYVVRVISEESEKPVSRAFTVYPRRKQQLSVIDLPGPPGSPASPEMSWRDQREAGLPLLPPVRTAVSPTFGRYRKISDTASTLVDYVAFRIDSDSVVSAPGNGQLLAGAGDGDNGFAWVDHGMGLYSRIGPLTHLAGAGPASVEAAQPLGSVVLDEDEDARFLYWSVYLNGAAVNPFLVSTLERAEPGAEAGGVAPEQ